MRPIVARPSAAATAPVGIGRRRVNSGYLSCSCHGLLPRPMPKITKLLVANRSEIAIRVFRAGPRAGHPHRRHLLARGPLRPAPLQGRRGLSRRQAGRADPRRTSTSPASSPSPSSTASTRIHPGYGFLSENPELARACHEAGIIFVGPHAEVLEQLGDKTFARSIAKQVERAGPRRQRRDRQRRPKAQKLAAKLGYPVILKAAKGGGGRGMRVVNEREGARRGLRAGPARIARRLRQPRRLPREVHQPRPATSKCRLLGDQHGNLVHLFERDCSVQRRHQKVVEIAPAPNLDPGAAASALRRGPRDRPGGELRERRHRRVPGRSPTRTSSTSSRSTRGSRSSTR